MRTLKKTEHDSLLIRGGRVIDPYSGRDETADVSVVDGLISARPADGATVVEAEGMIVCPGLMDIHVHLREPGQTHKETIATGTAAAAAGGFTFVACMPNTLPAVDHADVVKQILSTARAEGHCAVGPVAAVSKSRGGRELTDFAVLKEAGAVAFSDDGTGVEDDELMRQCFEAARACDAVVIQHCEYAHLSAGGVMHLGDVSRQLGLPGLDPVSEEAMIERDIALCRETGARYHVAHISTGRAVDLVRRAKAEELPVTAEVCPHHLVLTDKACIGGDPNTKMHPPLRTQFDVDACRAGLLDGTIDCIVTDHAPHSADEKSVGFLKAPPGITGLETALSLTYDVMIKSGAADWRQLIEWFTTGANRVLNIGRNGMNVGNVADMTLLNPNEVWTFESSRSLSKSRNTPFSGWKMVGRSVGTVMGRTFRQAI